MQDELIKLVAARRGHFRMESGYHSELWFDLDRLFLRPERLKPFVAELARRLERHRLDAVCGPVTGGAKLAEMIAAELRIDWFFAERFEALSSGGLFPIKYQVPSAQREKVHGKSIAIVDDAISAGSAVRGCYADVVACGARPVALGALILFGGKAAEFAALNALPLEFVAQTEFSLWLPTDCPLCRAVFHSSS